ncbi:FAR-17a/AIG1-like protein [Crassisporium funariophilum]|nr:FAR-17a/AIG1-like protein [Crassisporium funariophilum]
MQTQPPARFVLPWNARISTLTCDHLSCCSMAQIMPRAFFHATAASIMSFGYHSLGGTQIDKWIQNQYGGHSQYLTMQGLALAWLAMIASLLSDIFPSSQSSRLLKRYLVIIAMPLSVVISSIYWTLVIFFPQLIIQSQGDGMVPSASSEVPEMLHIPLPIDLALHAAPAVSLMADFFLFESRYDRNQVRVKAPMAAIAFALWYCVWVEHCGSNNDGIFPYPFLTQNPLEIRIGIYIAATLLAIASFKFINRLHG